MRKKFLLMTFFTLLFTAMGTSVLRAQEGYVAKVGDTYFATLAEAIAASNPNGWGTEVTLLKDITLEGGYVDEDEGLRIENSVTINGAGHTINCGTFKKGIRIYENGELASNVMFQNITIVNNNAQGRCIDTRSGKINLMLNGGVNLTAHGTNSQPLTIGGSEAMTKVTITGGTIDAGTSGYGVICFVPVTNHINVQSNAVIKGFAAFYLKEDVNNTSIKLSQSTSIGTNEHPSASGVFGAVVIEGSNNTVRLEHGQAVVKAVAGDGAEMAPQAAFLFRGNNNTVGYYNNATPQQVITEGGQSYFVMVDANVTGTKFNNNGVEMVPEATTCDYQFMTIEDALRFADDGSTVKLLADVTLSETYVNNKTLTIDLNGKTLSTAFADGSTTNHLYAIHNYGELTITDSSDAKTGKISARGNYNYGKLTLEAGTIDACDGNGGYAVNNVSGSEFIMNGGAVTASYEDGDAPTSGYDATTVRVESGAKATINGGEINNSANFTFAIDNAGEVTVNGGTVTSVHSTVSNYGTVTINGGSFTCNGLEGVTAHVIVAWDGSTTTINDGTFDGKDNYNGFNVDAVAGANVEIYGGNFLSVHSGSLYGDGTITVSGGTFFDPVPEARCAAGYIPQDKGNGTYGVVVAKVAKIGDVYYETLAEAVAAAQDKDVIEIIKEGNYTLPEFAGKELTFKGSSRTGTSITDWVNKASQGMMGSTVHFENLTISGQTENYYGLFHTNAVTYKNCNINGLRFLYSPTTFEGCAFNANGVEHSFWTYGASNVTVTGCTFTYTDRAVNCYSENGANHELDITFEECSFTYEGTNATPEGAVEINSGSVKSIDLEMNDCTAPAKGAMWFISQWDSADGLKTVVVVDGVVVWTAPAKIGETRYATLEAAVNAAQDGEEIDLLKDVELTSTLLLTKNNILDGNGFKLTPAEGFTYDGNNAVIVLAANMSGYEANRTYTVKNLTIKGFSTPSRIVRANFCDAIIQDCSFVDNASASIITSAYAVLNVAGNTFTNNTVTGYAVIDVGSDVSDGTNLVAEIIDNTFENNKAAIAGIYLASSADVKDNHFKGNTHTGDNANAAAILAGPCTGNMAYTVNIIRNAFESAMSKGGTALPSVFAEDWSSLGSTTSFDLSLNYWDGNEPEAGTAYKTSGENPQVTVKSYYTTYTDGTLGGLIEYPQGNQPIGYVSETTIWGQTWTNAKESYVIKVLNAENEVMGTSALNTNLDVTMDGDVEVTWHITLPGITDEDQYWIQEWIAQPNVNNMPAKVELWVDGVKVNEGPVQFNGPDDINKIYAATADAEGKLIRFYNSIETIVNNEANVNVVLVRDVTGSFETFQNVTLYSGVEGGASIINTYSSDYTNFNKVIVKNGVTLNMNNVFSTTAESVNTIEGTMNVVGVYYHSSDAKTEIKNGGKVTTGGMTIVRYNNNPESGIYIYGDGDDTTVEFSCQGDAIGAYSGTFYAEDAVVETKDLRLDFRKDNSEESDDYAQINAKFVDTKLSVSSQLRLYKDAALTLNGATVTADMVQIRENATPTINIDNSTIKANSVQNLPGATWNAVMDEDGYVTFVRTGLAGGGTEENPYLINNLEDLVFFREQVNTGNTYAGKYIKVTATEIDLNNEEWTPIGNSTTAFQGTFDGDNHTISNLVINGGSSSNQGFFGMTTNGEIKNVIFENAKVSGRLNVGVVAGTPYASKYTNIKVKGHVEVNGMAYVGGVGGKNAYANWTDITVDVDETSYVKANSVENGTAYRTYVGGVVGFNGEGGHTFKNITSNIKVIGSTCDIGGIFGIAHYGNNFENIEHSGSVINETNDATLALETGLIAGVWHNAKGTSVTFTNAASSGTISAPYAGVTFPENSLVGAAYTPSNETSGTSGSLIINGETVYPYVAKIGEVGYNTLAKAVTAAQDGETIQLLWAQDDDPIAMNASLYGKNVTIKGTATVDWSKGFLFVGRGGVGNAKLTFESANLTSASNSASYGIHVSGREKGTNDKYDGTLVVNNSTIDLDYLINKGTMTLDESTLTVKNGFSVGGRPGHETESGEDATATITLNNNSRVVVNNHNGMGLGYEAIGVMNVNSGSTFETTEDFLITAKGTMNVNGGNVKTVGTLTNNGAVNVTGNASMNVNTLTGNAINFTNVTIANANIGGAVNAFGTNNFTGETTIGGILSLGYETNPTEQVVVNITGNFNGVNVLIGSSNEHVLNVGNAESEKSTAHFGQLGAFGDVNIVNADVTYGYTFIRNDFNVTNSTMAINGGVNTYFSGNAKVVVDNSSWNLSGYANIGSYGGYMYGNADITLKNGSSMTATNLGIQVNGEKVVKLTLEDSSTLTATNLSNQGEIVLANVQAKVTSNELTGTNNVPTTTVADHKVVYENGAYVVTAKHYVAQVKGTDNNVRVKFETFAEALDAVENGETIELLGTEGSEISKELEFTKDITFTITGNAPNYALPIITFQNAIVNIEDATILIPELDARQDATINVIDSKVYDAGGNSIAKSYYNGAINISGTSEVYMMQVTTMGYINISGTAKLHATWQTNVYGNGLITLNNGATFNTAALHLTAQDYSGRDNTDADRVGKPAEIIVDGANFTVGNVHSAGGADYSYNSSKGINVGTVEGKSAILNIKNGGNVNIYMANGETANIGAGGTVNIAASTLNTICRAENGTVTLANNGNVYVTGEANLAANVTGAGWFYMNGVALDADTKLHGAKVGFINGVNTIVGSTIDNGFFSVGIGQNAAATTAAAFAGANGITLGDVTVNVSENAIIGGNGETYSGWVGSAYSADKTQHTYTLNVENSLAAFGYMHVSKDGIMYINGRSADDNKYTQDNSNVNFYAGDLIVNGNLTINNADAWVRYTKMSVDHADGVLNITGDTKYESSIHNGGTTGTSLVFYNAGNVNIANGTTIEIDNATTLVDGAELNIASANVIAKGDVDVTGNGAINFTALTAKLTAQDGLTIVDEVNDKDYKIVYQDGTYQFVAKQFVAQIYDVNNNTNDDRRYESLQEAIEAVAEGETVKLMADVTITEPAYGQNALNHARAINFTLDLNSKTLSANTGNSVFRFNIAGSGATDDVTVTIKNGKVVSGANTWCTLMSSGISADVRAVMNLEDLVIENYKGGDFAVKAWANGVVNAEGVTINSTYGGGFYALGGEITLDDCTVNQEGLWTAPYNSMAVGVSNGGKMTVKSGTYSAVPLAATDGNNQGTSHGSWTGGVMSSGGTLIINGGTFSNGNIGGTAATNPRELFIVGADADYGDNVNGQVIINGGTFTSIGDFIHCETIWGSANDPANTYMPTMGVTITAGDFTAVAGKTIGGCDPVSTGNPVDVEISGGTYGANHAIENSYLVVGYIVVDNEDGTYSVVEDQVAKIGDVTYKLLQEAIDAAQDGDEIVVLKDITLTEGIVIPADKTVTLDLAGCTVKQEKAQTEGYAMITNVGTLTIKDSSNPSTGKLSYKDTGDGGDGSFASNTIQNHGHLTILGGRIENLSEGQVVEVGYPHAIDHGNYSTVYTVEDVTLDIQGGTISNAHYSAIRMFCNSTTYRCDATISGGTIENAIDFQLPNAGKLLGSLTITGGTFNNINGKTTSVRMFAAGNANDGTGMIASIEGGTFNGTVGVITQLPVPVSFNTKVIKGGKFSATAAQNTSEDLLAEGFAFNDTPDANGYYTVIQVAGTQTREFAYPGWYWFSTYIDFESGEEGLDELQEQLEPDAATIKGQKAFTNYQYYNGVPFWTSALTSISASEMYMIKTTNECLNQEEQIYDTVSVSLEGDFVDYESYEITIHKGWNWIGYPLNTEVSVRDALAGFTPAIGDQIKGKTQGSTSTYMSNKWIPNFNMIPGEGYMYYSAASGNKTLIYRAGNSGTQNAKTSVEDNHWIVDEYKYSNNMTVIAMLSIDGEIVKGNYEVAAFANGECRGSARPIYIESIDAYVLFMTIHGDEVEELTFMYYDIDKDTEYELSNVMNYSNDAIVGTIDNPYIFSMNILGIGENSIDNINIYPNPTTTDREINLQATCDKVEVFNALGVKVAEYHNVDTLDALETAGIYVIRITNDNAVKHCRLVVK